MIASIVSVSAETGKSGTAYGPSVAQDLDVVLDAELATVQEPGLGRRILIRLQEEVDTPEERQALARRARRAARKAARARWGIAGEVAVLVIAGGVELIIKRRPGAQGKGGSRVKSIEERLKKLALRVQAQANVMDERLLALERLIGQTRQKVLELESELHGPRSEEAASA